MMDDLISRQAAISLPPKPREDRYFQTQSLDDAYDYGWHSLQGCIEKLPTVQPEIIDWQAIEHLQESGWMQNHDKQMYEMGLREQLADDSDSYDALLPSTQPERKKGAWINGGRIIRCNRCKIGYATVKGMKSALTYKFCPNCGADMRGEQG